MTAETIGTIIAVGPLVLVVIVLITMAASEPAGRLGFVVILGGTTLLMLPVIAGLAIAGKPEWIAAAALIGGLDVFVALMSGLMILVGRVRKGQSA